MQNPELYARLELITPTEPSSAVSASPQAAAIRSPLRKLLAKVVNYFVGSQQPRIDAVRDRNGVAMYRVYDPVTQTHHIFDSEQDVRIWLEERYYQ